MLSAIDLNHEALLAADKIDAIRPDRLLTSELQPAKPAIAQREPQDPLGTRAAPPQGASATGRLKLSASHRLPLTPGPLPAGGERESCIIGWKNHSPIFRASS